jgi:hypothetical protein
LSSVGVSNLRCNLVSTENGSYTSSAVGLEGVSGKFKLEIRLHKAHERIQIGSKALDRGPQLEGTSWEAVRKKTFQIRMVDPRIKTLALYSKDKLFGPILLYAHAYSQSESGLRSGALASSPKVFGIAILL